MTRIKTIIFSACGALVVVGLVLGLTLGGSKSGQTPSKKVMADARTYLMEIQRLLNDKKQFAAPLLCACCDTPLVDGVCLECRNDCDANYRRKLVQNAPFNDIEGGGAGGAGGAGAAAGGHC